jgi:hypothetical protein
LSIGAIAIDAFPRRREGARGPAQKGPRGFRLQFLSAFPSKCRSRWRNKRLGDADPGRLSP